MLSWNFLLSLRCNIVDRSQFSLVDHVWGHQACDVGNIIDTDRHLMLSVVNGLSISREFFKIEIFYP